MRFVLFSPSDLFLSNFISREDVEGARELRIVTEL